MRTRKRRVRFLGGPWDGKLKEVGVRSHGLPEKVEVLPDPVEMTREPEKYARATLETWTYRLRKIPDFVTGIPETVYVTAEVERRLPHGAGTMFQAITRTVGVR